MGETFERRDLSGAVFRDVDLHKALFEDVNLGEATIRNAYLKDLSIEDAYIGGLTINGIRVDELIEAELDRRDPERVRLRMSDSHNPEEVRAVVERLDEVRARFSEALRAADTDSLITRPAQASGRRWSTSGTWCLRKTCTSIAGSSATTSRGSGWGFCPLSWPVTPTMRTWGANRPMT
jgi:hypothetical protein